MHAECPAHLFLFKLSIQMLYEKQQNYVTFLFVHALAILSFSTDSLQRALNEMLNVAELRNLNVI